MSHPFGKLLEHYRLRKPGLSQAKLAAQIGYDASLLGKMAQGKRELTGPSGRMRVLRIVSALHELGVLARQQEANALLEAAGMPPLYSGKPEEAVLIEQLKKNAPAAVATHHNLPAQWTSFVGRADQVAELTARLRQTRLLTLTGSGGVGKTRLALEVAAQVQQNFGDGVWIIDFAPVTHADQMAQTAAAVFRLAEHPGVPVIEALIARLEGCHAVLIFDNCEHVIAASAALAEQLLQTCPRLHILATSREALRCAGETLWRAPSLSEAEAKALFVVRAQAVRQGFAVTEANAVVLTRICQQLDGMPLAIELAAARVNALSLEQIAGRLDDRFNLLTIGKRTALPRHQTLRTAIAWSFDLLTPTEQALMACLSVFMGGFTAEAAQVVFNHADTGDWVASLVDKSLVVAEIKGEFVRYRLLETIRQYSFERLSTSSEENQVRDRHLAFFLNMAEETMDMGGPHVTAWKLRMSFEEDNLRVAFAWASTRDDQGEMALRLAATMWPYRNPLGQHVEEGLRWVNTALARGSAASASARARALSAKSFFCAVHYDIELAIRANEESLALFRETDDRVGTAWCLVELATWLNDARSLAWAEESLNLFRELGSVSGEAHALGRLAACYLNMGDRVQAAQYYEQALAVNKWQTSYYLGPLYTVNPKRALELCVEEVMRWKEMCDDSANAEILTEYGLLLSAECKNSEILTEYGLLLLAEREYEQAWALMNEYMQWEERNSEVRLPAYWCALMGLALAELPLGHTDSAIAHLEQAQKLARTMSWIGFESISKFFVVSARVSVGNRTHAARDLRECLQLFQKLYFKAGVVCSLIQIADLAFREENPQHAARLFGAARTFGAVVDAPPYWINSTSSLWYRQAQSKIVEPTLAAARAQLGAAEFEAAFAVGQSMTLDEAITFALEELNVGSASRKMHSFATRDGDHN